MKGAAVRTEPLDEFDFMIPEPDPDLVEFILDEEFLRRELTKVRDAARVKKARLRAAKRAAQETLRQVEAEIWAGIGSVGRPTS